MRNNRVSLLRSERGLTQEDLSKALQITRSSISHYESGRREPDMATLDRMALFFECSVDYLIGRTHIRNWIHACPTISILEGLNESDTTYVLQLVERLKQNDNK